MSSWDTKITRTLLESGLGLLAKKYEKNPRYGRTRTHDNMVPWALRALGTKTGCPNEILVASGNRATTNFEHCNTNGDQETFEE